MSSNSNNNKKNNDVGYWVLAGFLTLCGLWPISIFMVISKLIQYKKEKDAQQWRQQNYQHWQGQSTSAGWQQRWNGAGTQSTASSQTNVYSYQQTTDSPRYNNSTSARTGNAPNLRQRMKEKFTSSKAGKWLMGGGITSLILGGMAFIGNVPDMMLNIQYGYYWAAFEDMNGSMMLLALGVILCIMGGRKQKQARKNREYFAVIGTQNTVSLRKLATVTGTDYQRVVDDMGELISKGAFGPDAYLDLSTQYLIMNQQGAQEMNDRAQAARDRAAQAKQAAEAEANRDPADEILEEIRRVNREIPDPHLTEQIDRIEEITRLILQCQREHPEKAAQLHTFLSYYLPTTLKILNAYADMEKQSVQGKNIAETRTRIEGMMDKVVSGFEAQLDQLFAGDRMDIATDITVLENMLAQDGLTQPASDPFNLSS